MVKIFVILAKNTESQGRFFIMKNTIKIIGIIALVIIGLSMAACAEENTWTFVNNSSYTVNITCKDLSPSSFSINSGATKTATSTASTINITYGPADKVSGSSSPGKFTFTDR
jgi:hypothetical protein